MIRFGVYVYNYVIVSYCLYVERIDNDLLYALLRRKLIRIFFKFTLSSTINTLRRTGTSTGMYLLPYCTFEETARDSNEVLWCTLYNVY
jgi:hypothetical protein